MCFLLTLFQKLMHKELVFFVQKPKSSQGREKKLMVWENNDSNS